jgi:hypothetical protein
VVNSVSGANQLGNAYSQLQAVASAVQPYSPSTPKIPYLSSSPTQTGTPTAVTTPLSTGSSPGVSPYLSGGLSTPSPIMTGANWAMSPSVSGATPVLKGAPAEEERTKKVKYIQDFMQQAMGLADIFATPEYADISKIPSSVRANVIGKMGTISEMMQNPLYQQDAIAMANLWKSSLDKAAAVVNAQYPPIDETVEVIDPTPEQLDFINQNFQNKLDYQTVADRYGMSDLLKSRVELMKTIEATNQALQAVIKSINENPELPKGLAQRFITDFTNQNSTLIQSLNNQLSILNQQVDDANKSIDQELGIQKFNIEQETERRKYQYEMGQNRANNARQQIQLGVSSGGIADWSDATLSSLASQIGLSLADLSAIRQSVAQTLTAKAEGNDAKLAQLQASTQNLLNLTLLKSLDLQGRTAVSPGQVVDAKTGLPVDDLSGADKEKIAGYEEYLGDSGYISRARVLLQLVKTGSVEGAYMKSVQHLPIIQRSLSDEQNGLLAAIASMNNRLIYLLSGKQINESEYNRLKAQLPDVTLTNEQNATRINLFEEVIGNAEKQWLKVSGWRIAEESVGSDVDLSNLDFRF